MTAGIHPAAGVAAPVAAPVAAARSAVARQRFRNVEELLADARSRLDRVHPDQAAAAVRDGARLVDIRPIWQRLVQGEIPGALVIERNHLEWRLDPAASARVDGALPRQRWIVFCVEGYTSSLAADALRSIGLDATDVIGGYVAWLRAGLPTVAGATPTNEVTPTEPR
jgi:rhodanese-related sulfurtransferase